ncbi:DUF2867 domain-containing protein [Herbaspirillum huttiense F1]|uniref:DUF2867 domain-containing protein n=1 Tax=Herbaspirillum huttiense subsp. lycopersici TaxID=3074428 RepID=A0ABU2EIZ2_9BURK|nr:MULTISPECIES: DUF2867 domain-containing protein [Herbaspirillum]MBP1314122.1 hypothetical protein [Herbaspirillum sp. 1130]MDR9848121.1 DUF2867 domain-containing protein [Herbaspirillum huttiense SE1]MDT0354607.1 DUF2867 domain-containing protein [Herbaspirillum huttiense F1]
MPASPASHTEEVAPAPRHWALLPGAGFADSYRIRLTPQLAKLNSTEIAARMMATQPAWVSALIRLRDRLMAPLGLKQAGDHGGGPAGFPLLLAEPARVVMGLDDRHLDFRLCVEKSPAATGQAADEDQWLTVTTVVRTKRLLGKAYLAAIMPFHRCIARSLLLGVVREERPAL